MPQPDPLLLWPSEEKNKSVKTAKKKGKKREKESPWTYPSVEPGSLTSATLCPKADRFEWSFISEKDTGRKLVSKQNLAKVFPQTRKHVEGAHDIPLVRRSDQGARFLRTYYPDVDIASEFIRDEIAEDARAMQALREFDSFSGDMMDVFTIYSGEREKGTYLAFPMGESYRDLNISPILYTKKEHMSLKSLAKPVTSFQTPIQQILARAPSDAGETERTVLGVRTYAATSFHEVRPVGNSRSAPVQLHQLATVTRSDVGGKPVMDVAFPTASSSNTLALLVNKDGAVFGCSSREGQKYIGLLYAQSAAQPNPEEQFWRIGASYNDSSCLLMSRKNFHLLDFRTHDTTSEMYDASHPGEFLISTEGRSNEHVIHLVTNGEILWIDDRRPGLPLLGIKHGRGADRTLTTYSQRLSQIPLTFLTSRRNGLVTVYDVSRVDHNLMHVHVSPYALPPLSTHDGRHLGHAFCRHSADCNEKDISIFRLAECGSISLLNLELSLSGQADDVTHIDDRRAEWPADVRGLEEQVRSARLDNCPLSARSFSKVDLRLAYKKIFYADEINAAENGEAVYETLDKMTFIWQDSDAPVEHMLTTYDIAFRSGPEPVKPSRNDVFTESALNSVRGFRALMQGRMPVKQLVRSSPWNLDISSFLRRFVPQMQQHVESTAGSLQQYDLHPDDDRPAAAYRRESDARQQLLLDLSLSSNVFSPHTFIQLEKPKDDMDSTLDNILESMSRATEAMSLEEANLPPVNFGYLRPVDKSSIDYYAKEKADGKSESSRGPMLSLGVRLLLKEWEIGTDPDTFSYQDPYNVVAGSPKIVPRRMRPPVVEPIVETVTPQVQCPPMVIKSSAFVRPLATKGQGLGAGKPVVGACSRSQEVVLSGSQPAEDNWRGPPSSQDHISSTQVLPGPHGGRPLPGKKKPVKKRIGGF